jgi:hypothetical protein
MKNLLILFIVSLSAVIPNLSSEVMAQLSTENRAPLPDRLRLEEPAPQDSSAAGSIAPQTSLSDNYQGILFDHRNDSFTARRKLSFSNKYHNNDSLTEIISSVMATKRNRFTLSPTGMTMDSGLSYSLPFGQHFSAFASLQPSLTALTNNLPNPQTMWTAGFQVPIAKRLDTGQDLSLRFSTAVDSQYRPIFFLSINMMSLGRK